MRVLSSNQMLCTDSCTDLNSAAPLRLQRPLPVRQAPPTIHVSPVPAGDASLEVPFLGPSSGQSLPTPSHSRSPSPDEPIEEPVLAEPPALRSRFPEPMTASDQDLWHRLPTNSLMHQLRDAPDTLLRNRTGREFPHDAATATWPAGIQTALPAAPDVRLFFCMRDEFAFTSVSRIA